MDCFIGKCLFELLSPYASKITAHRIQAILKAVRGVTGSLNRTTPAAMLVRGSNVLSMEDFSVGPIRAVPAWNETVATTLTIKANSTDRKPRLRRHLIYDLSRQNRPGQYAG